MCGIIGYVGNREMLPLLIQGLKRMEYRGYDSAGVALLGSNGLFIKKDKGRVADLEAMLGGVRVEARVGIGHTRWATHGVPNAVNAHPHTDDRELIVLAHNGIIENYEALREELSRSGHKFRTDTDTETVAQLIAEVYDGDLFSSVCRALRLVRGAYGLVILCAQEPDRIVAARLGSPMVIGHGKGENFVASDLAAFVEFTRDVTYLEDGEVALITKDEIVHKTLSDKFVPKKIEKISFDIEHIEKGGYPHFMLKEIHEQPRTIEDAMRGRLLLEEGMTRFGGMRERDAEFAGAGRAIFVACGTSWHAALVGEYLFEELAGLPVEVEYASEFRYRSPILDDNTVVFAISQSGETADTLAAVREAKNRGATVFGICNVVGSSIARETHAGVYLHAGPEIGVASTKAFTSQITVLSMLALSLGRRRHISAADGRGFIEELRAIPRKVADILGREEEIRAIAQQYREHRNFLYLGRGVNFPVALEGALKLKEISYIHAEGYPAAEMKHGPIALIDEDMPVVFLAIRDGTYEKILSNIAEVRARRGRVIAIATEGDGEIAARVDHVIYVPPTHPVLSPLLTVIPLQLLAYHMAVMRGCNVDMPRNLAKSVTVE
ncbi:MAG: glutamine--fructose-6-phosphate transaminase (isomerizing) [bacterium]